MAGAKRWRVVEFWTQDRELRRVSWGRSSGWNVSCRTCATSASAALGMRRNGGRVRQTSDLAGRPRLVEEVGADDLTRHAPRVYRLSPLGGVNLIFEGWLQTAVSLSMRRSARW